MTLSPTYLDTLRTRINDRLGEIYPRGPRLLAEPVHHALAGIRRYLEPRMRSGDV